MDHQLPVKRPNIHVFGIPNCKRKRKNGPEHIFEEVTPGNFQILWENFNLRIQDFNELQIVKEPKHITVKFLKTKDRGKYHASIHRRKVTLHMGEQ